MNTFEKLTALHRIGSGIPSRDLSEQESHDLGDLVSRNDNGTVTRSALGGLALSMAIEAAEKALCGQFRCDDCGAWTSLMSGCGCTDSRPDW